MKQDDRRKYQIMTAKEVCAFLKIPLSTLYGLTKGGKVQGQKIGKHWRYLEKDILNFFRGRKIGRLHEGHLTHAGVDRRVHDRINTEIPGSICVLLERKKNLTIKGTVHNLGPRGLFFVSENGHSAGNHKRQKSGIHVGDPVSIAFEMNGQGNGMIELEGRVVHSKSGNASQIGVKWPS